MSKVITIGIVDDHELFRKALVSHINSINNSVRGLIFSVCLEAANGRDLINNLNTTSPPDVILLDINMPVMNGIEAMDWIKINLPNSRVIVVSMVSDDNIVNAMLQRGAKGFITKDSDTAVFIKALESVSSGGLYFSPLIEINLLKKLLRAGGITKSPTPLSDREVEFLKLLCEELTYREIAERMGLSPRTIDNYREELIHKLKVSSRVGLVIFAINHGIYKL